ncbi:MAG: hypothetical protein AAF327_17490 [Cyanobacteria bacterium P01_A01_bin.37]
MKTYKPKQLKPSPEEFHRFIQGKISDEGKTSVAWKVVSSLFQTAQRFYSTLDSQTSERLSSFVDSKTYLTPLQEHDLVALTALYAAQLDMQTARDIVKQDTIITSEESQVLLSAIDLYRSSVTATCAALDNPRWVDI